MPYVVLEEPKSSANYKEFEQDGVKIYVSDTIKPEKDEIHFWLKKFLMFKEIIIEGVKVL